MLRLIVGGYLALMGFYAISNPYKLMQLGKRSPKTKDTNVVGVMMGGIGSVIVGLVLILWWLMSLN